MLVRAYSAHNYSKVLRTRRDGFKQYAILHTIRSSRDDAEATARLKENFGLDDIQAKAILDMQFRRLTGLARDRIENEYQELMVRIADLKDILANGFRVRDILKNEYGKEVQIITYVGSVIGAHSGPGTLALFFRGRER